MKHFTNYFQKGLTLVLLPLYTLYNIIRIGSYLRFKSSIFHFRDLVLDFNRGLHSLKLESEVVKLGRLAEKKLLTLSDLPHELVKSPRGYFQIASSVYLHGAGYLSAVPFLEVGFAKYKSLVGPARGNIKILSPSFVASIGHITQLSILAKLEAVGEIEASNKLIFYDYCANENLLQQYSKHFILIKTNNISQRMLMAEFGDSVLPMGIFETKNSLLEYYSAWNFTEVLYKEKFGSRPFLDIDYSKDDYFFEKLGLPQDAWFVSLHVREEKGGSHRNTNNVDPYTYIAAIKYILNLGGYVIRLGNPGMTPLSSAFQPNSRFIDYAHSDKRSPELDVFLLSRCRFLIGTASGPIAVPHEFGVPVLYTNATNIGTVPGFNGYCIPQTFFENSSGRELTLRETLQSPAAWKHAPFIEGLTRCKNTQEEILAGVQTMLNFDNSRDLNLENSLREIQANFGMSSRAVLEPSFLINHANYLDNPTK